MLVLVGNHGIRHTFPFPTLDGQKPTAGSCPDQLSRARPQPQPQPLGPGLFFRTRRWEQKSLYGTPRRPIPAITDLPHLPSRTVRDKMRTGDYKRVRISTASSPDAKTQDIKIVKCLAEADTAMNFVSVCVSCRRVDGVGGGGETLRLRSVSPGFPLAPTFPLGLNPIAMLIENLAGWSGRGLLSAPNMNSKNRISSE